jgi:hypothetical protein
MFHSFFTGKSQFSADFQGEEGVCIMHYALCKNAHYATLMTVSIFVHCIRQQINDVMTISLYCYLL